MDAVTALCTKFGCSVPDLKTKMENHYERARILDYLKSAGLYVAYTNVCEPIDPIDLTVKDSNELMAYNGFLKVTVYQHFYARHRINLKYPWLPCVMTSRGKGFAYYPLELVKINAPKPIPLFSDW